MTNTVKNLAIKPFFSITLLTAAVLLAGCQSQTAIDTVKNPPLNVQIPQQSLVHQAAKIQKALATGHYEAMVDDIHPTLGVRFSMYAYVQPKTDKVFSRSQFAQYSKDSKTRFTWGEKDGVGDLLVIPLPDFLTSWLQADKFQASTMTINNSQSQGNTINNAKAIYPAADIVEFYSSGTQQYSGMDWRAMRLVFEEYQGRRYLVAIISDQWTV